MAESDPEYIKAVSEEHMPNFICNLCSRHSNFEFFLRGSSDVDSHTRGRQHQQKLGDYPNEGDAIAAVEEPAEELRICTLCNKVLKKRRVPAHLRDKRHLAAVELGDLMKPEQAPAPLSDNLDFEQLSKLSNLIEADFLRRSLPQEEIAKRDGYRAEIEDILRVVYPAARVELFGSSLNGFGTIDSDLDLFVKVPTEVTLADALEDMSLYASETSYDPALDPADSVSHSPITMHRRGAAHVNAGAAAASQAKPEDVYRFSQAFSAAYALDDDSDDEIEAAARRVRTGELYSSSQALSAVHAFDGDDDSEDDGGDPGAQAKSGAGNAQAQAQAGGAHRKRQRKPRRKHGQGPGPVQPEAPPHHEGGGHEREVRWQAGESQAHGDDNKGQHGRGRGRGGDRGRGRGRGGDRGRGRGRGGDRGRGRGTSRGRGGGRGGDRGRGRGGDRGD